MITRRLAAGVAASALSLSVAAVVTPAAEAAPANYFSSCAKLNKKFSHGVSKSGAAAAKQVAAGYERPSTTKKAKATYKVNKSRLDRDNDGTACER